MSFKVTIFLISVTAEILQSAPLISVFLLARHNGSSQNLGDFKAEEVILQGSPFLLSPFRLSPRA
jgi:hypothetical protein